LTLNVKNNQRLVINIQIKSLSVETRFLMRMTVKNAHD
jgi:hypothetical protein